MIMPVVPLGDGLAQFDESQAMRIMRLTIAQRLGCGFDDSWRRVEVRFPDFEVDNVHSRLALDGLGALQYIHDQERADVSRSSRNERLSGEALSVHLVLQHVHHLQILP